MSKRWVRAAFPLMASLLVVAGGIVAYVHRTHHQTPEGRPRPGSLQPLDLETFKRTFNGGAGEVRVLAMLSPT